MLYPHVFQPPAGRDGAAGVGWLPPCVVGQKPIPGRDRRVLVFVEQNARPGILHPSPGRSFDWGNHSPESRRLARAILSLLVGHEVGQTRSIVQAFMDDVVSCMPPTDGWQLLDDDVLSWVETRLEVRR